MSLKFDNIDYYNIIGTENQLRNYSQEIQRFNFQKAPQESVLLDRRLPYLALEALHKGFTNEEQAATTLNFWGALRYHQNNEDLETIELFQDPRAEELLKQTLQVNFTSSIPFLEGQKFHVFMENMQKQPVSERHFLLVPDIQENSLTISQTIKKETFINVFNRVIHEGKKRGLFLLWA